jgi:SOS-response transcriptional repressor LexA
MDEIRKWLRERLAETKTSQRALSLAWGAPEDAVNKFLRGVREISAHELMVAEQTLESTAPRGKLPLESRPVMRIMVVGEVAAGVWQEMDIEDFQSYELSYPADPRFPEGSIKAFRIKGNSINRQARDGDHAIVLDIWQAPRDIQEGDWVVVRRTRGHMVECTVKRVSGQPGNWQLWPDSDDPRFQDPIVMAGGPDSEVEVIGFVLDFVRPATII